MLCALQSSGEKKTVKCFGNAPDNCLLVYLFLFYSGSYGFS